MQIHLQKQAYLFAYAVGILTIVAACSSSLQRFPMRAPMTDDPDQQAFAPEPEEYFSPFGWDAADQTIFRPISRFFAVDPAGRAINVNARDEVPNSSWFTNRIDQVADTETFLKAGCGDGPMLDPEQGPWKVTSAKLNGANPGFVVEAPDGTSYLLKFDGTEQPERATSADVIGSVLYWNAGYFAPCNRVQFFDPKILKIEDGMTYETQSGEEKPLTKEVVDEALKKALRLDDGRVRGSSSRFVDGKPIGPWRYQSTRDDDPNDVVAHEDRRELRGGYVIASWLNHFDTREQNTMSAWMSDKSQKDHGHVRHYYIDFGDCFGSEWEFEGITRRLGHSNYLDIRHIFADWLTFGAIDRAWHNPTWGPAGRVFQYFNVADFEPDEWKPGYPNPAFSRMQEEDGAWMARILAKMSEADILAAVELARFQGKTLQKELGRVLLGRRQRILERWFRNLSPLADARVDDANRLCATDLAVHADVAEVLGTDYLVSAWGGFSDLVPLKTSDTRVATQRQGEFCFELPNVEGATRNRPAYLVYEILAQRGERDTWSNPVRVHLYQLGAEQYLLVGVERPDHRGGIDG